MVRAIKGTAVSLLGLVVCGCTSQVGTLLVSVTRSPVADQEPLQRVASFVRIRVDGPDLRVGPLTVPLEDHQARLPEVPVGEGRRLTLEGLGPEGDVVSRGRSALLTVRAGDNKVAIYLGRVGTQGELSFAPEPLREARAFHAATLLADGSVLLSGGTGSAWRPESLTPPPDVLRSVEQLEASSLRVEASPGNCQQPEHCLSSPRVGHTASLLPSGNVLLAGGSNGVAPADSVELYQPERGTFVQGSSSQKVIRVWHQAASTDRGLALVGGVDAVGGLVDSAQVYDQGTLHAFPTLGTPRRAFSLTALADGRLLVAGGFDANDQPLSSTEVLGAGAGTWTPGPDLAVPRAYHTATLLGDGSLLLVGGLTAGGTATGVIERLDASTHELRAQRMTDSLWLPRWGHSATLLSDGRVLVVGGFGASRTGAPAASVEGIKFLGEGRLLLRQLGNLREARAGHSATRLASDFVAVAGGYDGSRVLDSVEVFVY